MQTLIQDVRFGFRTLLKSPGFTAPAVISLALGIGACTAIFSIVDAVLIHSLPYPEPGRIVQLREISDKGSLMPVTEPNFLDVGARNRGLEAIAEYSGELTTVTGGSEPARAETFAVSTDFFRVLGVPPFMGRSFAPEESKPGGAAVAIVSYGFWRRLLGGKADITSTILNIENRSFSVVGVMPPRFNFPQNAEVWIARELFPSDPERTAHNWNVIACLRAGVSLERARADLSAIGKQLKQEHGEDTDAVGLALVPLHQYLVGNVRDVLLIILVAVGFLLLIACTNVANLLLAQVTARQKEFVVRAALGATRLRLARQSITENVLLALAAGGLGVLCSYWGIDLLISLNRGGLPRADEVGVDSRALLFTFGLSLLIAVGLGLVAVTRFSTEGLQAGLKESGRGQAGSAGSPRGRDLLVVLQMALTLVLLITAGLLGKSFYRLLQIDPGFLPESAVVMDLSLPSSEDERRQRELVLFKEKLLEHLGQLPGVIAAGSISNLPMTSTRSGTFLVDDNPANTGYAEYRLTSGGYFAAMRIPLLRGRLFDPSDRPDSPHVAIISQSLAKRYWRNEDPIGKLIQFGNMDGDLRLLHIVGIVGDVRDRGLDSDVSPMVYADALQRPPYSNFSIVVRARTSAAALVPAMRQAVKALNPNLPSNFRTLEQIFTSSLDNRRFSLVLLTVFAGVALTLAVTGIYGLVSYSVSQRTHEIGVRMALGAQQGEVFKLVVSHGLRLALLGVVIGLAVSLVLTRFLQSILFGVKPTDPVIFAGVSLALIAVALAASYLPARRASRVDPMVALRYE